MHVPRANTASVTASHVGMPLSNQLAGFVVFQLELSRWVQVTATRVGTSPSALCKSRLRSVLAFKVKLHRLLRCSSHKCLLLPGHKATKLCWPPAGAGPGSKSADGRQSRSRNNHKAAPVCTGAHSGRCCQPPPTTATQCPARPAVFFRFFDSHPFYASHPQSMTPRTH